MELTERTLARGIVLERQAGDDFVRVRYDTLLRRYEIVVNGPGRYEYVIRFSSFPALRGHLGPVGHGTAWQEVRRGLQA